MVKKQFDHHMINRGSYISAHLLLNLLNELKKGDKMRGLLSILSIFHNKFNKFNNTGARMLDSILSHDIKIILKCIFGMKTSILCHFFLRNVIMDVITPRYYICKPLVKAIL